MGNFAERVAPLPTGAKDAAAYRRMPGRRQELSRHWTRLEPPIREDRHGRAESKLQRRKRGSTRERTRVGGGQPKPRPGTELANVRRDESHGMDPGGTADRPQTADQVATPLADKDWRARQAYAFKLRRQLHGKRRGVDTRPPFVVLVDEPRSARCGEPASVFAQIRNGPGTPNELGAAQSRRPKVVGRRII